MEERIISLEIKFAHQEDFIQQLNQVVVAQASAIERLQKEMLDLKRLNNPTSSVDPNRTLADDKPPHY